MDDWFCIKIWSCFFWIADFQNLQFIIMQTNDWFGTIIPEQCWIFEKRNDWDLPSSSRAIKYCKALFLTGNEVYPSDLEACHHLKKKGNVTVKFKSRKLKYKVINNRKTMKNKSKELNKLKFSNNLYISESMCAGNHSLLFKCCKLKKARKIFNTWFFNNTINVQLNQSGEIHKV